MALTDKQRRFVQEYLVDLNATQAAIRAGYSEKTARSVGSENLTKPDIVAAIEKGQAELAERLELSKEQIVEELRKIAFLDIRKAVRWGKHPLDTSSENAKPNGLGFFPVELVPSEEIDPDTAAAVSEVSLTQSGVKIKMHDKKGALVDLAKMLGFMIDKHEHTGPNGGAMEAVLNVTIGAECSPMAETGPSVPEPSD